MSPTSRNIFAVLRGLRPDEALDIGGALIAAGIDRLEVPLNSPDPFDSIARLANAYGDEALIGAGTVLEPEEVERLAEAGGRLVVSPDCNPAVIRAAKQRNMISFPGVMTPSECFTALRHGADGLKLFPSFQVGPEGLKALTAVLPRATQIYAVGGVGPSNFAAWRAAGAVGFGIGTALFTPGASTGEVARRAAEIVAAFDAAFASGT